MKKYGYLIIISMALFFPALSCPGKGLLPTMTSKAPKKYDLLLIHGLTNRYPWSESFLERCLEIWGSGNVYALYMNDSIEIKERMINGRSLITAGRDDYTAGSEFIEVQARYMHRSIKQLQETQRLGKRFSIIAHSMGGLVSRYYIYAHPDTVAGLVTLGTPHHGSPLAHSFKWAGTFLHADDALSHLEPDYVKEFNRKYPIKGAPLFDKGRIFTIRGDADGWDCFGWGGELPMGWIILQVFNGTDNDGLVPTRSAVIDGARHIADFKNHDHFDLTQDPAIAEKAAQSLK